MSDPTLHVCLDIGILTFYGSNNCQFSMNENVGGRGEGPPVGKGDGTQV